MPNWLRYILIATGLALLAPGLCTATIVGRGIAASGFFDYVEQFGGVDSISILIMTLFIACWNAGCLGLSMLNLVFDNVWFRVISRVCGGIGLAGVVWICTLVVGTLMAGTFVNVDILPQILFCLFAILPGLMGGLPSLLVRANDAAKAKDLVQVSPFVALLMATGLFGAIALIASVAMVALTSEKDATLFAALAAAAMAPGFAGHLLLRRTVLR